MLSENSSQVSFDVLKFQGNTMRDTVFLYSD